MSTRAHPPHCGNCANGQFWRPTHGWRLAKLGSCLATGGRAGVIQFTDPGCGRWAQKFPGRPK